MVNKEKQFVHLHNHTEYSLLDGAIRITRAKESPLFQACKERNMDAIAITDHGNMYGVYTFYKYAKQYGIKPIIGCEFYVTEDMSIKTLTSAQDHLTIIAKNNKGYANLVKLDSMAFIEGFYRKPRIDLEFLSKHTEGLICLSGCLSGHVSKKLLDNDYEGAKEYALKLKSMFADGDFYIEIQDHGLRDQKRILPLLVKIAHEIGVKCVATNDAHYISKEDAEMHDLLLCMQTGRKIDDAERMRFPSNEFYLKTYDEMYELFSWIPEALESTVEIANKCDVTIEPRDLYPPYEVPRGETPYSYLKRLTFEGLDKRYPVFTKEIEERALHELKTIHKLGFDEYYLIVWDFVDFARRNKIAVGPGRGSGVGSIVAYALGITAVDPLKYNLLFERFLNEERVSSPDFDIDFCVEGREKIIEYVIKKYGSDKVCQIITFGTLASRAAFKDVARVYNIPFDESNKIAKLIPQSASLDTALGIYSDENISPELVEIYQKDPQMHKILDFAREVEGMPKNSSKHAAGVVICKDVISDSIPLQKNGDDITTQFQKDDIEELGMLKMDFLGLRTLTDIDKTIKYVKQNKNIDIDFSKMDYNDPNVYKLIASGDTDAVFQLESDGMKNFMKDLMPTRLEDIIAGISLYRPGPMKSIPAYTAGKRNPKNIKYKHELLENILDVTYGCIVYQEQVMQIVRSLAGYTLGRADILRRAMGKKKVDQMNAEREVFIYGAKGKKPKYDKNGKLISLGETPVEGAIKKGVSEEIAKSIFSEMEDFAKYAFNKSHAAGYAVLAYQTAYLKTYHLPEFITAVLNNRITDIKEVSKYVNYLRNKGIKVYPPDINKSDTYFKVENGNIRFGLSAVKNVGVVAMDEIIAVREKGGEFKDFMDFIDRSPASALNKKLVESLALVGAFESLGINRRTAVEAQEELIKESNERKKTESLGQFSIFDLPGFETEEQNVEIPALKEYDKKELLKYEKELASVYFSGHPLDDYTSIIKEYMNFNLSYISEFLGTNGQDDEIIDSQTELELVEKQHRYTNSNITFIGVLTDVQNKITKSNKLMSYVRIEDTYGEVEGIVFPKQFQENKHLIREDAILQFEGRFDAKRTPWQFIVNRVYPIQAVKNNIIKRHGKLFIDASKVDEITLDKILKKLEVENGGFAVIVQKNKKLLKSFVHTDMRDDIIWYLTETLTDQGFKFVEKTKKHNK